MISTRLLVACDELAVVSLAH